MPAKGHGFNGFLEPTVGSTQALEMTRLAGHPARGEAGAETARTQWERKRPRLWETQVIVRRPGLAVRQGDCTGLGGRPGGGPGSGWPESACSAVSEVAEPPPPHS